MITVTLLNLIALLAYGAGLFFWKKKFPQKKLNLFYLLMIFLCIPLLSVWRKGSYQSGDFQDHIYFLISFYNSLRNGIWFPRWSGAFCGGYGYPHIQFFYHLPYYIASFFHAVGFSFVASQKLLICFSFLGSGASLYLWLKSEWGKEAAFIGTLLCLLAPYTLAGAHFRVTLGEGLGLAILPLIFWCVKKTFDKKTTWSLWYWWGISALYVLLILAHHVVPILCLPFVVSYFCFKMWQSKKYTFKNLLFFFISLGFSFLMTSYHWAPILIEAPLIGQDHLRIIQFPAVYTYFFSPYRFGLLNQGPHGELTWTVGYVQWLFVITSALCLRLKKFPKKDKNWLVFLLVWFVGLFIMLLPFTNSLWVVVPILNNFQFSNRLLFLIAIVVAMMGAILVKNVAIIYSELYPTLKKIFPNISQKWSQQYLTFLIVFLTIALTLSTILNWGQRAMIPDLDDLKLTAQIPNWCDKEAVPNGLNVKEFKKLPKRTGDIDVISGAAEIAVKKFEMEDHEYQISATSSTNLRENTTNFAGWTLYIDGQKTKISDNDPAYKGVIEFEVQPGIHQVKLVYEHTVVQRLFVNISLIGLILSGIVTASFIYRATHD